MTARFIPPFISEEASNAEHKVFDILKYSTLEMVVFHSLGVVEHRTKIYGEIDFVIISRYGVLCLEVKGGAIECKDGIWKYYNRYGELHTNTEGPFKQAVSGMFSLRDMVKKHPKSNFRIANALFACGVVFPDTVFNKHGIDFIPEIVFDERYNPEDIDVYIKKVFGYWRKKCIEKTGYEPQQLTTTDISLFASILRSDFELAPSYRSILEQIDSRIIKLTDEQFAVFEALSDNDRIIVAGSAGTGKTILGLQYASQAASEGKNVLFLTYNRMLAEYLRHKTSNSKLDIVHFHGLLNRYIDVIEEQSTSEYYESFLPDKFLEYAAQNDITHYDMVIIDEGQDLLRYNYLLCIDMVLAGGLEKGKWVVLLDPNQNIYNDEFESCFDLLKSYPHTDYKLVINCRNTRQIGTLNAALHVKYQHPKYLRVEGDKVVINSYESVESLIDKLRKTIKDLIKKGISLSDVIILMPVRYENSSLKGKNIFKSICSFKKATELDFIAPDPNTLRYSTVHNYKGLEAKVIILFDFDLTVERHEMLSYIAMSRAKTLLYIFADSRSAEIINNQVKEANALDSVQIEA